MSRWFRLSRLRDRVTLTMAAGALSVLCFATAPVSPSVAGETQRLDLYDRGSRRAGYVVSDPATGRVDLYDAYSRRLGYGHVESRRVDVYAPTGQRLGAQPEGDSRWTSRGR
jgi:hypothetical protein